VLELAIGIGLGFNQSVSMSIYIAPIKTKVFRGARLGLTQKVKDNIRDRFKVSALADLQNSGPTSFC